ncbi:MAG: hypothetical protein M1153_01965 [Patescibacteria group bacterium]|nr:hypothetical protein [Patescibacteria group bacterium]
MKKINYLAAAIIAAGLFVSLGLVANAQVGDNAQTAGGGQGASGSSNGALPSITFPIPELGNCSSKDACEAYCSDTSHMQACIRFAQGHGMITNSEAVKEKGFANALANASGPGGCNSPDSCQAYCSNIDHLQTCLTFARSHGLSNAQTDQGRKILSYLQSGGKMPGGCTSQDSCQAYCNELAHAEECFAFSQKIGIAPPSNGMPSPTLAQIQKISALAQSGQTPGGCTTMQACQEYCNNPANSQACQQFGTEVGFTGGPDRVGGPGGCNSPDSCQAYCNDPSHQTECLQFAQQHGLMTQGQVENFQNGMNQFQNGLNNAPQQVVTCLQDQIGAQVLSQMQSGQFTPTPDVMNKIQTCFQSFRPSTSTPNGFIQNGNGPQGQGGQEMTVGDALKHMPPDVYACVQNKLGGSFPSSSSPADQNFGQAVQSCYAANPPHFQNQGQFNQQGFPPVNQNGQAPFQPQNGSSTSMFPPSEPQPGSYNNYGSVSGTPPIPPFQGSSTMNFQGGQQPVPNSYPAPQPYNSSSTSLPPPGSLQPMPGTQTQSSSLQSSGGNILNAISNFLR